MPKGVQLIGQGGPLNGGKGFEILIFFTRWNQAEDRCRVGGGVSLGPNDVVHAEDHDRHPDQRRGRANGSGRTTDRMDGGMRGTKQRAGERVGGFLVHHE